MFALLHGCYLALGSLWNRPVLVSPFTLSSLDASDGNRPSLPRHTCMAGEDIGTDDMCSCIVFSCSARSVFVSVLSSFPFQKRPIHFRSCVRLCPPFLPYCASRISVSVNHNIFSESESYLVLFVVHTIPFRSFLPRLVSCLLQPTSFLVLSSRAAVPQSVRGTYSHYKPIVVVSLVVIPFLTLV